MCNSDLSQVKIIDHTKNRTPSHMLSNIGLHLAACTGHDSIFNTGGKFRPVSTFTELHTLTLATRSYMLLHYGILLGHDL